MTCDETTCRWQDAGRCRLDEGERMFIVAHCGDCYQGEAEEADDGEADT